MRYKVDDVADYAFEKVKNIVLGSGKIYYVYDNDEPVLSVEVNIFTCFSDVIIFHTSLVIGNYYEGLYIINLDNYEVNKIEINGYFGYFKLIGDILYVLGCENVIAFDNNLKIIWESEFLAFDGVVFECIEGDTMTVSCEMDPPGGWTDKKINLQTGKIVTDR